VPEAPGIVVVESLSDTSIKLCWRPPVSPNGNITGFTIEDVSVQICMRVCIYVIVIAHDKKFYFYNENFTVTQN